MSGHGMAGAVFVLAVGLAGCTGSGAPVCPAGLNPLTTADLYFGRAMDDGREVSDADWQRFVDEDVTPRFPNGFTVHEGAGQWLGARGLVREKSKHMVIVLDGRPGEAAKLTAIRAAYETRFHQESVGLVETRGCASFGSVIGDIVSAPPGR
jgi:hypothetical protein